MPRREAPPDEGDPRALGWLVAALSLVLPVLGVGMLLVGIAGTIRGLPRLWLLIPAGVAALVLDLAIDLWWTHPEVSRSDEPDLNLRAAQLIGRTVLVAEAIRDGRGKVRVGDTLWAAEGADMAAESRVRITAVKGTVLVVEPAQITAR